MVRIRKRQVWLGVVICLSGLLMANASGRNNPAESKYDFETGDLQGWRIVEGEFGKIVSDRAVFHNTGEPYNKQGKYYLSTLETLEGRPNDRYTGVLESPRFTLQKTQVMFWVGGGRHDNTYVALCTADGREVFRAGGLNTELMRRVEWDADAYAGQKVFIRIVDRNTGSWGHVTFDHMVLETPQEKVRRQAREEIERKKREVELAQIRRQQDQVREEKRKVFLADDSLFVRGKTRVYHKEYLGAIDFTVGGIGSGCIRYDGRARPFVWQIFNNSTQTSVPHSFLAVRVQPTGGQATVRALQTEAVGPFAAMKALRMRGEYPFAWYEFVDGDIPVRITMEIFNPMIPLDGKNSAIPCAIINLTAENPSSQTVDVSYLASQQNAVGFTGSGKIEGRTHERYGGNSNTVLHKNGGVILHMTSKKKRDDLGFGDMAWVMLGEADHLTGTASWQSLDALRSDFAEDGALEASVTAGPSSTGKTLDGALAAKVTLKPGQTKTVTVLACWYFPNGYQGAAKQNWGGQGNRYSIWWTDALDVARYLRANLNELTRLTRLYHDSFYATNLPYWLLDRMSSQTSILRSRTCFWLQDGYFGVWEGCCPETGCCMGNCNHVWQYAQGHARLYPELGRRMREEVFGFQKDDGLLPHRHPNRFVAFDGQCGDILGAYREHLLSPDSQWLTMYWPKIKKAMDFVITKWDTDQDGVLAGAQHNTLDTSLGGSSTWLGSLYVAGLAASEKMAQLQDEPETAKRYRSIRLAGAKTQNETLWNGEYYIQIPDPEPQRDYRTGCAIDQMLGQWWALQLDLGWFYPYDRVQSALRSVFQYNFKSDFIGIKQAPRKFVSDTDMGTQMICWPHGDRPDPAHCTLYADEVMTGFEYSAAAAMWQAGLMKESFATVKAISDRYDGRLRTDLTKSKTASWGYSGNPFGDDECGKFYGRALSVWSMLLVGQGFIYDGPAGVIGFKPAWKPQDHVSFFTAAEGWGLFSQSRKKNRQTGTIKLRYGKLKINTVILEIAKHVKPTEVAVTVGSNTIESDYTLEDNTLKISLASAPFLHAGDELSIYVKTK